MTTFTLEDANQAVTTPSMICAVLELEGQSGSNGGYVSLNAARGDQSIPALNHAGPPKSANHVSAPAEVGGGSLVGSVCRGGFVKLYLSSYRLESDPEAIRALTGTGKCRAGLVFNAVDGFSDDRLRNWDREEGDLSSLGFDCVEVDLRDFFGDPVGLSEAVARLDLLWVVGGNAFVLAGAMHLSGFDHAVRPALRSGDLVYAGYSAGACVTGPDLDGIHLIDVQNSAQDDDVNGGQTPGLGWIPWRIIPHFDSPHPESPRSRRAIRYLRGRGLEYWALRDGEALVVDGESIEPTGGPGSPGE